jgi:hypothetical protein
MFNPKIWIIFFCQIHGSSRLLNHNPRLNHFNKIPRTVFMFINRQEPSFFFYFFPHPLSKHFPLLVVLVHFRVAFILALIVLPNTRFCFLHYCSSMCCDVLRHIITKDNTPRLPLHLSPQQTCSLSQ